MENVHKPSDNFEKIINPDIEICGKLHIKEKGSHFPALKPGIKHN